MRTATFRVSLPLVLTLLFSLVTASASLGADSEPVTTPEPVQTETLQNVFEQHNLYLAARNAGIAEFTAATDRTLSTDIIGDLLAQAINHQQWLYTFAGPGKCHQQFLTAYTEETTLDVFTLAAMHHNLSAMAGQTTDPSFWVDRIGAFIARNDNKYDITPKCVRKLDH